MAKESKRPLKRIPTFRSAAEEARWYGAHCHDLHEYIEMEDAKLVESQASGDRGGMTQAVSLRLPRQLLTGLRRVAEQQEITYQMLIKQWLTERLAQESAPSTARRPPSRRSRAA
jgi:predicted DNA-binding ribbon-helix-helix protein